MLFAKTFGKLTSISPALILALSIIFTSIPYSLWQGVFINKLAEGPHAAAFLFHASANGDLKNVQSLHSRGIALNIRNVEGKTPIHGASISGHLEVVKYLVESGADYNVIGHWGNSPLEYAISEGHKEVADYLSSKGAQRIRGTEEQRKKAASKIAKEE